jgi:hypothetical protein
MEPKGRGTIEYLPELRRMHLLSNSVNRGNALPSKCARGSLYAIIARGMVPAGKERQDGEYL